MNLKTPHFLVLKTPVNSPMTPPEWKPLPVVEAYEAAYIAVVQMVALDPLNTVVFGKNMTALELMRLVEGESTTFARSPREEVIVVNVGNFYPTLDGIIWMWLLNP